MINLKLKTKKTLLKIASDEGLELDPKLSKKAIIEQIEGSQVDTTPDCACGKTEDENGKCDGSHAKRELKVEKVTPTYEETSGSYSWSGKMLAKNGAIIQTTREKARYLGRKKGGRQVKVGDFWQIKKY